MRAEAAQSGERLDNEADVGERKDALDLSAAWDFGQLRSIAPSSCVPLPRKGRPRSA